MSQLQALEQSCPKCTSLMLVLRSNTYTNHAVYGKDADGTWMVVMDETQSDPNNYRIVCTTCSYIVVLDPPYDYADNEHIKVVTKKELAETL